MLPVLIAHIIASLPVATDACRGSLEAVLVSSFCGNGLMLAGRPVYFSSVSRDSYVVVFLFFSLFLSLSLSVR